MNFLRKLRLGRKREVRGKDKADTLFSLSSSYISLQTKLGLRPSGRSALSIKAASGTYFFEMEQEIKRFLASAKTDIDLAYRSDTDSFGYLWMILEGKSIEDHLAGMTAALDTIEEKGFSNELLAILFEFLNERNGDNNAKKYYLIYNYKRNNFYPFVLTGIKSRSTEEEMKIMAAIADEMPFEKDMSLWYPIWDIPI